MTVGGARISEVAPDLPLLHRLEHFRRAFQGFQQMPVTGSRCTHPLVGKVLVAQALSFQCSTVGPLDG